MSFADELHEDQRLAICQILEQDVDYSHNDNVIQKALAYVGHRISSDLVRTHISWLDEQGLVSVDRDSVASFWLVKLTMRGEDAALGRARIAGVARPRPS